MNDTASHMAILYITLSIGIVVVMACDLLGMIAPTADRASVLVIIPIQIMALCCIHLISKFP